MVRRKNTKEDFAVKAFSKKALDQSRNGKMSLINEIKMLRLAQSEFSMKLQSIYETENSIYLVLELMKGGEIFKMRNGALTSKNAQHIIYQLIHAIKDLKKNKLIHRDLKPSNIMFKKSGVSTLCNTIKLADFGLSTIATKDSNLLFRRCGTPGFIAPEVVNFDREKDTAEKCENCDIYSAGVIFFFMLLGRLPFQGESFKEILEKNEIGQIDWDSEDLNNLEVNTLQLLKSMLTIDPKKRITPEEAINHPYFYQYINQQQPKIIFNRVFSGNTQATEGQFNSLGKYNINVEVHKIDKIDDLFQSDSEVPDENPNIAKNMRNNHLGEHKTPLKLSPFIETRQLNKAKVRAKSQIQEETNDTFVQGKLYTLSKFNQQSNTEKNNETPENKLETCQKDVSLC